MRATQVTSAKAGVTVRYSILRFSSLSTTWVAHTPVGHDTFRRTESALGQGVHLIRGKIARHDGHGNGLYGAAEHRNQRPRSFLGGAGCQHQDGDVGVFADQ